MENENTFNEQEVKEQISQEVRAELNNMGYRILEADEVGSRDMCRLVNNFKNKLIEHDTEAERIKGRYSDTVAESKLNVLEADFRYDKESLVGDIDKIIEQDQQRRLAEAERLQATKDYKADKKEAIEMLCLLRGAGVDITDSVFLDTIEPLIEAKDIKGLEVIRLLAGNKVNEYLVDKATDNINNYFNNEELRQFGDSAKQFILNNEAELTLSLHMAKFENILRGGK